MESQRYGLSLQIYAATQELSLMNSACVTSQCVHDTHTIGCRTTYENGVIKSDSWLSGDAL